MPLVFLRLKSDDLEFHTRCHLEKTLIFRLAGAWSTGSEHNANILCFLESTSFECTQNPPEYQRIASDSTVLTNPAKTPYGSLDSLPPVLTPTLVSCSS
jgi:hypothetical protein